MEREDPMSQLNELTVLKESVALHPDSLEDVLALADAYADRGHWHDAVEAYQAALALDSKDPDLHNDLGAAYEELSDTELAEQAYRKAIALHPNYSTAYFNLGGLYREQKRLPEAILAFEKCLELSSDNDECSDARKELRMIRDGQDDTKTVVAASLAAETYAKMLRAIRSWGRWLLALGAIHLVATGSMSAPWGIILLIVGAASFYFREASMFVIYGATLAWAAVSNLLSGEVNWIGFAIAQFVLAFQVFRQFVRFRDAEADYATFCAEAEPAVSPIPQRAARIFPWAGGLLGALSLLGLMTLVVGMILLVDVTESTDLPSSLSFFENLIINLGILGLAVGLATLLSNYQHKRIAVLGIVASVLVLVFEFTPGIGEKVFRSTETVLSLAKASAAEINLQTSDLDASFSLIMDQNKDAFAEIDAKDGSGRLFFSTDLMIESNVVVFHFYPTDTTSELRSALEIGIQENFRGQSLVFEPGVDMKLGDRGSIQKFRDTSAGKEGYASIFIKRKVAVSLIVYGSPEEITADDVQDLAHIIEERIQ